MKKMTYKPVSLFTKRNSVSNDTEYYCWYYSRNSSMVKARVTKTTFDNLKNELFLMVEIPQLNDREVKNEIL